MLSCLVTASRRGLAKFRLAKFNGYKRENFIFHFKEIEFRYNTKNFRTKSLSKFNKIDKRKSS